MPGPPGCRSATRIPAIPEPTGAGLPGPGHADGGYTGAVVILRSSQPRLPAAPAGLVVPVLAVLVLAAGLGACSLPLVSETEVEDESTAYFEQLKQQEPISTNSAQRAYVNCVANAIIAQLPEPYASEDWEVVLFENDQINAFAVAGGKIGVYTGIFKVAETPGALATVLGHEVAHVTQQHPLERANRAATTQIGVIGASAVLGGGQATGSLLSMASHLGLDLPYSRADESEADKIGLRYMASAGFNPSDSINLWKTMAKKSKLGPAEFLSDHPSDENRIKDLIAELPPALALYNQAQADGRKPTCHT